MLADLGAPRRGWLLLCLLASIPLALGSQGACDSAKSETTWTSCIGRYELQSGDRYFGGFLNGRFHGLGRFSTREGWAYVGFFENGRRVGLGVEYDSRGQVTRQGWWQGSFDRPEALNVRLFPRVGDLPFGDRRFWSDEVSSADNKSLLETAKERIVSLEAELADERRKNTRLEEELRRSAAPAGLRAVQTCLDRGLRPGTSAFSKCVGN